VRSKGIWGAAIQQAKMQNGFRFALLADLSADNRAPFLGQPKNY